MRANKYIKIELPDVEEECEELYCFDCETPMETMKEFKLFRRASDRIEVTNVPVQVCHICGIEVTKASVMDRMLKTVRETLEKHHDEIAAMSCGEIELKLRRDEED